MVKNRKLKTQNITWTIYKIFNKNNGLIYIGQTYRSLNSRMREHKNGYICGAESIAFEIKKYGKKNFDTNFLVEIICNVNTLGDANI